MYINMQTKKLILKTPLLTYSMLSHTCWLSLILPMSYTNNTFLILIYWAVTSFMASVRKCILRCEKNSLNHLNKHLISYINPKASLLTFPQCLHNLWEFLHRNVMHHYDSSHRWSHKICRCHNLGCLGFLPYIVQCMYVVLVQHKLGICRDLIKKMKIYQWMI